MKGSASGRFALGASVGIVLQFMAIVLYTRPEFGGVGVAGLLGALGAIALMFGGWHLAANKGLARGLGLAAGLLSIPGLFVLALIPARVTDQALRDAPRGDPRLFRAAAAGDAGEVARVLDEGAAVDGRDKAGRTPLHVALDQGHTKVAELLVERGAGIDCRDKLGNTPLHMAAELGSMKTAAWLVDQGADVNARGNDGWTPLHLAAAWGATEVARVLVERGADLEAVNNKGRTPKQQAEFDNYPEVVEVLRKAQSRDPDTSASA